MVAPTVTVLAVALALVLLGDGKEKAHLVQQAEQLGLDNVLFLPPLPKIEVPQALAAADACVAILKPIPEYRTVYPNKVFDYMAAGRPVILAIEGVIQQVVEQAEAGLCILPGDPAAVCQAVQYLKRHRAAGRQMGENGRRYVEQHFDRQALAARLEECLLAIAEKK